MRNKFIIIALLVNVATSFYNIGKSFSEMDYMDGWETQEANIIWVSDAEVLEKLLEERSVEASRNKGSLVRVYGFFGGNPEKCIVYAPEPRNEDDFWNIETLGHEVLHCFRGYFHK